MADIVLDLVDFPLGHYAGSDVVFFTEEQADRSLEHKKNLGLVRVSLGMSGLHRIFGEKRKSDRDVLALQEVGVIDIRAREVDGGKKWRIRRLVLESRYEGVKGHGWAGAGVGQAVFPCVLKYLLSLALLFVHCST
jgi:hypothetical protein